MDKYISELNDVEYSFLCSFKTYILFIGHLKKPDNLIKDRCYIDFISINQRLIEFIACYFEIPYSSVLNFIYEEETTDEKTDDK